MNKVLNHYFPRQPDLPQPWLWWPEEYCVCPAQPWPGLPAAGGQHSTVCRLPGDKADIRRKAGLWSSLPSLYGGDGHVTFHLPILPCCSEVDM